MNCVFCGIDAEERITEGNTIYILHFSCFAYVAEKIKNDSLRVCVSRQWEIGKKKSPIKRA